MIPDLLWRDIAYTLKWHKREELINNIKLCWISGKNKSHHRHSGIHLITCILLSHLSWDTVITLPTKILAVDDVFNLLIIICSLQNKSLLACSRVCKEMKEDSRILEKHLFLFKEGNQVTENSHWTTKGSFKLFFLLSTLRHCFPVYCNCAKI